MLDRLKAVLKARFGSAPALTQAPRGLEVLAEMANRRVVRRYSDKPLDPALLVPALLPLPEESDDGTVQGEVLWVDRFGNVQLNVDPEMLSARGVAMLDSIELRWRDQARGVRWVETYADGKPSELVMVTDSYGLLSLAIDRQHASQVVGLSVGTVVTIVPAPSRGAQ